MAEKKLNTYILIELTEGHWPGIENLRAVEVENYGEALIAFNFHPYDPWEDFATGMFEKGIITEKELDRLRTVDDSELAEVVLPYALAHWGPSNHCILEIRPDDVILERPGGEMCQIKRKEKEETPSSTGLALRS
jgi:hypothetical protein